MSGRVVFIGSEGVVFGLVSNCPVCASQRLVSVVDLPPVPIDTCRMWSSRSGAMSAPMAPIHLVQCDSCSHVFNRTFDKCRAAYEEEYENSQMFSQKFQKYATDLAQTLIEKYQIRQKYIVEIGGGRGDFLRLMCDLGNNLGTNICPSYRPALGDDIPTNIRFITDYYSEKYACEPAHIIICRHVLEHVADPGRFVEMVRRALDVREDLFAYFEVPNGSFILREQICWEFIYQHFSYFTKKSLVTLFNKRGFKICDVQERFAKQSLSIEACVSPNDVAKENSAAIEDENTEALCRTIGPAFEACCTKWSSYLERQRLNGGRVVLWGAGAKAVTFLNIIDPNHFISHIVDVNPRKTGRFVAGSGQEIIEPRALCELRPAAVILMNAIYREEIGSALNELGIETELLVA
jgi:C-methyltransferase C-terminal domain/Methyltransferase domain